jgi:hypothetical protein
LHSNLFSTEVLSITNLATLDTSNNIDCEYPQESE